MEPKKYNPAEIERKWQEVWEKNWPFKASDSSSKPKFYVLCEFPYPSGEGLHMGHVFNYTMPEVYARKKRLEGKNVLFPIGWDAFGLPTENFAIRTGTPPAAVTKRNTDQFRKQFKSFGYSFDWSREINTTSADYYKWTQWIFLQLFKNGLAYKAETPVGWCPSCKIVLANEEVINGKCERCGTEVTHRMQKQWVLRITTYADRLADELDTVDYPDAVKISQRNWIGRKVGINISYDVRGSEEKVVVFTTRPDTNFGATFVVLAPEHPKALKIVTPQQKPLVEKYIKTSQGKTPEERLREGRKKSGVFTGAYAINQLNGETMPIWVADFVLMDFGTGALVGVPGHDKRDFEFAKEFNLPIKRVVVGKDGNSSEITDLKQVQEEEGTMTNSDFLDGLDIHAATEKMMDYLEVKGWGEKVKNYHLRDWIFSRQHYWGEPIPMIFCPECASKEITYWDTEEGKKIKPLFNPQEVEHFDSFRRPINLNGWFPLKDDDLPLQLPEVEKYQPTETGESPLAKISSFVETTCPNCGGRATRETDTMPNWAGSSWYYLRYCDTANKETFASFKKLGYWMPVDVYFGGAEHTTLHLLYSRFWHKVLSDLGLVPGIEPYAARRQHGIILAEDGSKMSKSKGNVVNPDEMVRKYGADAMRTYLCFMGPYEQTMPWNTKGIEGVVRFLNRVWKIYQTDGKIATETSSHLKAKMAKTIKRVSSGIDDLSHNVGVAALMEFLNSWEKEGCLSEEDSKNYLVMLSVFTPHLAEDIWSQMKGPGLVCEQMWPEIDKKFLAHEDGKIAVSINGKTRAILTIGDSKLTDDNREQIESLAKADANVVKWLSGKKIKKVVYVPGKIINFVVG